MKLNVDYARSVPVDFSTQPFEDGKVEFLSPNPDFEEFSFVGSKSEPLKRVKVSLKQILDDHKKVEEKLISELNSPISVFGESNYFPTRNELLEKMDLVSQYKALSEMVPDIQAYQRATENQFIYHFK